jgi:hypothetical protein
MNIYGGLALRPYCEVELPRADLSLVGLFIGSVSRASRKNATFFSRFLVTRYPQFFTSIPWEQTGHGLSETPSLRMRRNIVSTSRSMTANLLAPFSRMVPGVWRLLATGPKRGIADYMALLRSSHVREQLSGQDLLLDEYMRGEVRRRLKDVAIRLDARALCAILTLESYLQQVAGLPRLKTRNLDAIPNQRTLGIRSELCGP